MPDRKRLGTILGIASTLVLLAFVLVASARVSRFVAASSRPDTSRSHLTLPPAEPTIYLSEATDTDSVPNLKALTSEDKEEDGADALIEPRASLLSLCSFREVPERQLVVPRSIPSLYPLRC